MQYRWLPILLVLALPAAASSPDASPRPPAAVGRAPVALLVDLSSGQTLYEHNADTAFLPASMTKVMTALVVFDLIKAGKVREDTQVTVRGQTAQRWAGRGSTLALTAEERISIGTLLLGTTIVSANDAAVVLAESCAGSNAAFVALMNARARQLGMTHSHFASVNGFPDSGATYVTARDLAVLGQALIEQHPALYRRYFGQPAMPWRGAVLRNRDPLVGNFPGADGIKTGHTFEAGFNFLGSAARGGRRLLLIAGGAQTETDRANVSRALAEWGFSAWESEPFVPAGWKAGTARVQDGARRSVALIVPRGYTLALPVGTRAQVSARIVYSGPIRAPIAKGKEVARLEIRQAGLKPYSLPLIAAQDVGKAGPIDRIVNGLLGLVQ